MSGARAAPSRRLGRGPEAPDGAVAAGRAPRSTQAPPGASLSAAGPGRPRLLSPRPLARQRRGGRQPLPGPLSLRRPRRILGRRAGMDAGRGRRRLDRGNARIRVAAPLPGERRRSRAAPRPRRRRRLDPLLRALRAPTSGTPPRQGAGSPRGLPAPVSFSRAPTRAGARRSSPVSIFRHGISRTRRGGKRRAPAVSPRCAGYCAPNSASAAARAASARRSPVWRANAANRWARTAVIANARRRFTSRRSPTSSTAAMSCAPPTASRPPHCARPSSAWRRRCAPCATATAASRRSTAAANTPFPARRRFSRRRGAKRGRRPMRATPGSSASPRGAAR